MAEFIVAHPYLALHLGMLCGGSIVAIIFLPVSGLPSGRYQKAIDAYVDALKESRDYWRERCRRAENPTGEDPP